MMRDKFLGETQNRTDKICCLVKSTSVAAVQQRYRYGGGEKRDRQRAREDERERETEREREREREKRESLSGHQSAARNIY